ncbi:MAG: alpha/beta hydrolase [Thermoleophilaceae bacterium]|nr:alpha/beta hydrolase [Thermoleophilaceae bacterium]
MEAPASNGFAVPPAEPFDPELKTLADSLPGGLALPVSDDPVKSRDQFRRITVALREQLPPGNLERMDDITVPGAAGDLPARVYIPVGGGSGGTLLFLHGGGFIVGDIPSYELQVRTIAERTGMITISPEYRLAPEEPFPAAADDAVSIATWVVANVDRFGGDASRVVVAGDSAGGNLAAVVGQHVDGIAGQVLIYPTTDFSTTYASVEQHADGPVLTKQAGGQFRRAYLGGTDPTDPRVSPLLGEDFGSQPPSVVVTSEYDILRDEGLAYAAKLSEYGVPVKHLHYPSLMHGFMGCFPFSKACDLAMDEICGAAIGVGH